MKDENENVPAPTVATDNRKPLKEWTALEIAIYAVHCGNEEAKIEEVEKMIKEYASPVEEEQNELLDIVHELFSQACYQHEQGAEYGMYDHMCISTYEEAQSLLIKHNRIKKEQCYRD